MATPRLGSGSHPAHIYRPMPGVGHEVAGRDSAIGKRSAARWGGELQPAKDGEDPRPPFRAGGAMRMGVERTRGAGSRSRETQSKPPRHNRTPLAPISPGTPLAAELLRM